MNPRTLLRSTAIILAAIGSLALPANARETLNFNPDWRFIKEDVPAAKDAAFDDSKWATVSCPHTYNDVDTFDTYSLSGHRGEQDQWSGKTWYRKTFIAPADWKGKKVFIEFEAVRQQADVYLNGTKLGTSKTGFTPFGFDLTPQLKAGEKNTLAVLVDNRFQKDPYEADGASKKTTSKPANGLANPQTTPGLLAQLQHEFNQNIPDKVEDLQPDQIPWNNPHWHPAHGGIYRNVKLTITEPVHIELPLYSFLQTAGPYAYATDISEQSAKVTVEVPVKNEGEADAGIDVAAEIKDRDGKTVATLRPQQGGQLGVAAGKTTTFELKGTVTTPQLWEPDYPYLYRVVVTVFGVKSIDFVELPLGIRQVRWDKDQGFFINGHHEKLHGWGQKPTDEWPGLGNAQPDWLHWFTLNLMKQAGGNWVRWGHCAGGPAQIASCDRLGIMVDQPGVEGESDTTKAAWLLRASAFRDVIIYYRNNPSVMIWEGGNQKVSAEHAKELRGYMEKYDPHGGRAYAHRRSDKITAEFEDVLVGTEGGREFPHLPVVEGEYNREESPRRVWDDRTPRPLSTDPSKTVTGYPEAKGMTYQLTGEQFAVNQIQHWLKKCGAANHAGGANWIFSDSTSGGRVPAEVARASGEVDGVRLPKDAYFVCKAMFGREPFAHVLGHWNCPEGTTKDVYVVSNCASAMELVVNGKTVGKAPATDGYLFKFADVKFEPGVVETKSVAVAAGSRSARIPVEAKLKTAGPAHHLNLTPVLGPGGLIASGSDVALVDVEVVDEAGQRCPTVYAACSFTADGPAVWRGGYNSGKEKSTNKTTLDLECGVNRVSLRSTLQPGMVKLTAQVEGLPPATVEIESKPFELADGYSKVLPALPDQPVLTKPNTLAEQRSTQLAINDAAVEGKLFTHLSYTGPSKPVRLVTISGERVKAYSDSEVEIANVPAALRAGEMLQLPGKDHNYSALDLVQFTAGSDLVLYVAYDSRLPAPKWVTSDFQPTSEKVTVNGATLALFKRPVKKDASVTLGGNTDSAAPPENTMYVVFATPAN